MARKIHSPPPTSTHPHTPDKARKNYLSHKSLLQAEAQESLKDEPAFLWFYILFFFFLFFFFDSV